MHYSIVAWEMKVITLMEVKLKTLFKVANIDPFLEQYHYILSVYTELSGNSFQ